MKKKEEIIPKRIGKSARAKILRIGFSDPRIPPRSIELVVDLLLLLSFDSQFSQFLLFGPPLSLPPFRLALLHRLPLPGPALFQRLSPLSLSSFTQLFSSSLPPPLSPLPTPPALDQLLLLSLPFRCALPPPPESLI